MLKKLLISTLSIAIAVALMAPYHAPNNTVQSMQTTANETPNIAMTELFLGTEDPRVAITNLENSAVQLNGWFLCNRPGYFQLPNITLNAGQRMVVHLGISGTDTDTDIYTGGRLSKPSTTADEMALYSSGQFGNVNNIVDYVQWGRAGQSPSREGLAIRANLWNQNAFVDISGLSDSDSIYFDGTDGNEASDYFIAPSGLNQGNSADVLLVHSLNDLSISPSEIELKAGQATSLMNVSKDGDHNPIQLLDAAGNVVFDVSFELQSNGLTDIEFTPSAGVYTLTHAAHGHAMQSKIVVR